MNILVINPILFTANNGIIPKVHSIKDTMIYSFCLGFVKLGHKVTLAAVADYKPQLDEQYEFEVHFFETECHWICHPDVLPSSCEMYKFIRDYHNCYQLIIASELFQITTLYAAVVCPERLVVWQEMSMHQNKMCKIPSKLWYNIIVPILIRKIAAVIPRSAQAYAFVKKYTKAAVLLSVDHGVDISKFPYTREKKRQVISSSQLIRRKNVDRIIAKFARLHKMLGYDDIHLIIAGRGEEESYLKKLVGQLGLNEFVDFVGFLPQVKLNEYIRESMCFLIDTSKDLNMVSIPEAIASGTPVLMNDVPTPAHDITGNHLGIVNKDWNEADLKYIIDHNAEYVDCCINYNSNLTNEYSAQKIIDIFNHQKTVGTQ